MEEIKLYRFRGFEKVSDYLLAFKQFKVAKAVADILYRSRSKTAYTDYLCQIQRLCFICTCFVSQSMGAQWLSGRVLDWRPRGCQFEPHRPHCVVVLEQDIFILA